MEKTTLLGLINKISPLSKTEQTQVKGGLLIYCEEKRRSFLGIQYTTTEWRIAPNGKLGITVQM